MKQELREFTTIFAVVAVTLYVFFAAICTFASLDIAMLNPWEWQSDVRGTYIGLVLAFSGYAWLFN